MALAVTDRKRRIFAIGLNGLIAFSISALAITAAGQAVHGLAFDPSGNLFVVEYFKNTIFKFNPDGKRNAFASGLNEPLGLACDKDGNVFVSDSGSHSIIKFSASSGRRGSIAPMMQSDQSITGDWIIHFQAAGHTVSGNLHLQADGERLTGTIETAHTGPGTVQNGKWSNRKLAATLVFEKHESVALEGELKSDGTLAGNYKTEGRTETWQAERKSTAGQHSGLGFI